jgi:hypothetical protein
MSRQNKHYRRLGDCLVMAWNEDSAIPCKDVIGGWFSWIRGVRQAFFFGDIVVRGGVYDIISRVAAQCGRSTRYECLGFCVYRWMPPESAAAFICQVFVFCL